MSDQYEIDVAIKADSASFQESINAIIGDLGNFNTEFANLSQSVKNNFASMANQFQSIDAKYEVWGDSIDVVAEKQGVLKNEINKLISSGISPASKEIQDLKNAYDALGKEQDNVKDGSHNLGSLFASMRDIMQGPVAVFNELKNVFGELKEKTVGQAASMEDMIAAFTPLVGGAENAKVMMAALNKEAATTPFELSGIASVSKQLLPVLGNDVTKVTETFRMLGDTSGGSIEKLDSITRGYVKTLNTGKVSLEALNMISDAGVPIQTQLADSMGMSVASLYKMISAGSVSSTELTKAFQKMTSEGGIFFQGMKVASTTYNAEMAGLSDAMDQAGQAIGNIFLPQLKETVHAVAQGVMGFASWANENDNLKKTLSTVIPLIAIAGAEIAAFAISANISNIIAGLSAAFKTLSLAIKAMGAAMLGNPIGIVITALGLLATALVVVQAKLGGWNVLWLYVQKGALEAVNGILIGISWFANQYINMLNVVLKAYNDTVGKIAGKQVPLLQNVDLSKAAGITKSIDEIDKKIDKAAKEAKEKTKKANEDITDNSKKTGDSLKEQAEDVSGWTQKYADDDTQVKLNAIANQKAARQKDYIAQKADAKDLADELEYYDDLALEQYAKQQDAKRAKEIAAVNKSKETESQKAADIKGINEHYDNEITVYHDNQIEKREQAVKDYSDKLKTDAEKRATYESVWADKAAKSASDLASKQKGYSADTLQTQLDAISKQEDAEVEKAKANKATEETIANIHKVYANQMAQATIDSAEKQKQAYMSAFGDIQSGLSSLASTIGGAGSKAVTETVSAVSSIATAAASGFTDIKADIKAFEDLFVLAWDNVATAEQKSEISNRLAKIGELLVDTLAPILKIVIDLVMDFMPLIESIVLILDAVMTILSPIFTLIQKITNFIISVLVAAMKGVVIVIKAIVDSAIGLAKVFGQDTTALQKLSDQMAAFINTSFDVSETSKETTAQQKSDLADLMKTYDDATKTKLQLINEERDTAIAKAKALGASEEQLAKIRKYYSDQYNTELESEKTTLQKISDAYKSTAYNISTQLSKIESAQLSFVESFANIGTGIASSLISGFEDGLSESDWLSKMKTYIFNLVVQTAVYTDSMKAKLATIGQAIASAVSSGLSTQSVQSIKDQLSELYKTASTTVSAATGILNSVFGTTESTTTSGYATGTDYATAGWHTINEAGQEKVYLPQGAVVANANESASGTGRASTSSNSLAITINSPEALSLTESRRQAKILAQQLGYGL